MTDATDFTLVRGIPFSRVIRVPNGKTVWPDLGQVEVRSQLRKVASPTSELILNLHDFMTLDYGTDDQANDVIVTWAMTGAEVRAVPSSGHYDVILSDTGPADARASRLLFGQILVETVITSPEGDL